MFLEEKEYNHVIDLMENRIEPSPLLSDFRKWFYDKYKVRLYAYLCDTTITELTRLRAVLFDHEDSRKFHNGANLDKKYQREIADKFSELSIKYKCNLEYQNPKNVFVCYETIKDEISKRVLMQAEQKIKEFTHEDIWRISVVFESIHVFYQTDAQLAEHSFDGTNEMIDAAITTIVKPYDKYDIFPKELHCTFTSKQTLDEQYDGSMYFYLL